MSHANKIEEIHVSLGYECVFSVNCLGHSGAYVYFGNNLVCVLSLATVTITSVLLFMSRLCGNLSPIIDFSNNLGSCVWDFLRQLAHINSLSWLLMGDFNKILSQGEKRGGAR